MPIKQASLPSSLYSMGPSLEMGRHRADSAPQSLPARRFQNVEVLRDCKIGNGAYATVYQARCNGELLCAAKVLHWELLDLQWGPTHPQVRFTKECEVLSALRHPNVVQYLGTWQDPVTNLPVLLMELMDESLTQFLEQHTSLPFHTQVYICHDVALALSFLHSNKIIHRDLSSNNVLMIGDRRAKVTDFGMATLLHSAGSGMKYTRCPGSVVYMPPEVLGEEEGEEGEEGGERERVGRKKDCRLVYDCSVDCFSFGVLLLQVLTGDFPKPTDRHRTIYTTEYPAGHKELIPEVQRRYNDIERARAAARKGKDSLLELALDCLKDQADQRPNSSELCRRLEQAKGGVAGGRGARTSREEVVGSEEFEVVPLKEDKTRKGSEMAVNGGGAEWEESEVARLRKTVSDQAEELMVLKCAKVAREAELLTQLSCLSVSGSTSQSESKAAVEAVKEEIEVLRRKLQEKEELVRMVEEAKLSARMEAEELRQQLKRETAKNQALVKQLSQTPTLQNTQGVNGEVGPPNSQASFPVLNDAAATSRKGAWSISLLEPIADTATVQTPSSVTFDLLDSSSGKPSAGKGVVGGVVSAELRSQVDPEQSVKAEVITSYRVSYTPTMRGRHVLSLQVNDTEIASHPVMVLHPADRLADAPTPQKVIRNIGGGTFRIVVQNGLLYSADPATLSYHIMDLASGKLLESVSCKRKISGIAVDPQGNVYITSNHKIHKYSAHGERLTVFGSDDPGNGNTRFKNPQGLAMHEGCLHVCDTGNARVMILDANLTLVMQYGMATPKKQYPKRASLPQSPCDITFHRDGRAFVLDGEKKLVAVFKQGVCESVVSVGQLSSPTALCCREDHLFVTDWPGRCFGVYDTSGQFLRMVEFGGSPVGICADLDGFIYIANTADNSISVY